MQGPKARWNLFQVFQRRVLFSSGPLAALQHTGGPGDSGMPAEPNGPLASCQPLSPPELGPVPCSLFPGPSLLVLGEGHAVRLLGMST